MRRHPNKSRNAARHNVLHAQVWSTRIVRIAFFKVLFRSFKPLCLVTLLAAAALGIRQGIRWALYDNPDFRLQAVDLNPNPAIDELDFAKITGINLRANLFRLDREALTKCLTSLPQLADAQVQRQLPGTLVVRVTARSPRAWIACPAAGLPATRSAGAMLVDDQDIAYPCPPRQLETAASLPIIVLPARDKQPIASGKKIFQPELQRCLRLLTSASDPDTPHWIDSIQQANAWSLCLTTSGGTVATLGLSDHARQVANLRAALRHAEIKGYAMATINLIPKENVPITIASAHVPAPVTSPDPEPEPKPEPATAPTATASNEARPAKSIPKTSPTATPKSVPVAATAAPSTTQKTTQKSAPKTAQKATQKSAPKAIPVAIPVVIPRAIPVTESGPKANRQDHRSPDQKTLRNRN